MKKIKLITLLFIISLGLLLVSCKTDITKPVLNSSPGAPALSDLALTVDFTVNNADSTIKFSWTAANYGFAASVDYVVEVSPTNDFSSNVAQLIKTQALTGTAKISDINTLLISWNDPIGTAATLYYRVSASLNGTTISPIYSTIKTKSLTPYDAVINYPMVYVPGSYQGWSPGGVYSELYSYGFNSTYQGIIRLIDTTGTSAQFKVTSDPDWNHTNWGGILTQSGNNYTGTLDPSGNNFEVANACYSITVDVNAKTISLNQTDDWGIIGDFNSWSTSVPLNYNGQRKMWEISYTFAGATTFKFRANNAWDLNYGSNNNDGNLDSGGSNIPIPAAGNYTIRFDPVKLTYTIMQN